MGITNKTNQKKKFIFLLTGGIFCFLALYAGLASWYLSAVRNHDSLQIQKHGSIIAYDLWNLNEVGMKSYLNLVAQTEYYQSLNVYNDNSELFSHSASKPLTGLDNILLNLHLIYTKDLSTPIRYQGQLIGKLQGELYVRYVYPLTYLFLEQFFLTITLLFIIYLIFHRRILKQQVIDRTRRYHEMVNLLPEMVLETDADGIITFANERTLERFGLADLCQRKYSCNELIQTSDTTQSNWNFSAHVTDKNLDKNEYKAQAEDGHLFPVLIRSAPIYKEKQLTGTRIVIVDITERNNLLEQLNRDQKMKSIGMMAGGVAHDLNNILSGIINYPEMILTELPEESPLRDKVKRMKDAGLRAAAVVADLLTVARGVAAPQTIANLNILIQEYLNSPEFHRIQASNPPVSYEMNLAPEVCNITCSIIHVKKCIMNLVANGSEAIPDTGQVIVATSQTEIRTPLPGHDTISPGAYTVLSVQDTGGGIPQEDIDHIFEPFYSKKELGRSGTGLGLTVVWNTMQDHKGGVRVTSSNKGTLFELFFPCTHDTVSPASRQKDEELFQGKGQSILIVDDEPQQLHIASQFLTSLGYQVKAVSSGKTAIDFLEQRGVDLLLLDMVIGPGLNGRQTYEKAIQLHPRQKAIVMSGFSESDDVKITLDLGAGRLLNKPYTKQELAEAVFRELQQD